MKFKGKDINKRLRELKIINHFSKPAKTPDGWDRIKFLESLVDVPSYMINHLEDL